MRPIIAYWKQSLQDAERNRLTLRHDNHIRCTLTKLATGQPARKFCPPCAIMGESSAFVTAMLQNIGTLWHNISHLVGTLLRHKNDIT